MPEVAVNTANAEEQPKLDPAIAEQNAMGLRDYLKSLTSDGTPIKVAVIRELPKSWEGRNIEGTLETFEEPISEEEIREMFGGGKYKLVVHQPNARGSWVYATSRKIKIAGDPKLDGLITSSTKGAEEPTIVRDAMRMTQSMLSRAEDRANRAVEEARHRGPDPATEMMMREMAELRREMSRTDERLLNLATAEKGSSAAEMLLGKAIEGESARMQQLRSQVESEMRMKNDMHKAEVDRLHARYEDIAKRQEDAHKREIDNLIRAQDNQMTVLKSSFEGQVAGYQREISHLDRQLTVAQQEVAELRAKKDKSLLDSMTEMAAMKDAMETFSGKSDDEGGSTVERIINTVMGSSLVDGVGARLAGGAAGHAMQAMPQPEAEAEAEAEIPIGRPVTLPDGRVIFRKPDGTILQLRRREASPQPTGDEGPSISDEEINIAMTFMESALSNDRDPAEFGATARNLAPSLTSGPIQELLKTQGVDAFLARVAKLNPNSALLTQHGKNWARKVAAVLIQ